MKPYKYPDRDRSNMKPYPKFSDAQLRVESCEICKNYKDVKLRKVERNDGIVIDGWLCDNCAKTSLDRKKVKNIITVENEKEPVIYDSNTEEDTSIEEEEDDTESGDLLLI